MECFAESRCGIHGGEIYIAQQGRERRCDGRIESVEAINFEFKDKHVEHAREHRRRSNESIEEIRVRFNPAGEHVIFQSIVLDACFDFFAEQTHVREQAAGEFLLENIDANHVANGHHRRVLEIIQAHADPESLSEILLIFHLSEFVLITAESIGNTAESLEFVRLVGFKV